MKARGETISARQVNRRRANRACRNRRSPFPVRGATGCRPALPARAPAVRSRQAPRSACKRFARPCIHARIMRDVAAGADQHAPRPRELRFQHGREVWSARRTFSTQRERSQPTRPVRTGGPTTSVSNHLEMSALTRAFSRSVLKSIEKNVLDKNVVGRSR